MTYYFEWDHNTTAWLRELIAAGLISDGTVDERDIRDVRAEDGRVLIPLEIVNMTRDL